MSQPEAIVEEMEEEIARVREARHRISERVGHDPYRLVAYYMERQKAHRDRLIRAPEEVAAETAPLNRSAAAARR